MNTLCVHTLITEIFNIEEEWIALPFTQYIL